MALSPVPCFPIFHVFHSLTRRMVISLQDCSFNIWNNASRNIKEQNTPIQPLSKLPKGETQRSSVRGGSFPSNKEGHHAQGQLKALYICHPMNPGATKLTFQSIRMSSRSPRCTVSNQTFLNYRLIPLIQ